jgi:hypothetical protein
MRTSAARRAAGRILLLPDAGEKQKKHRLRAVVRAAAEACFFLLSGKRHCPD